MTAGWEVRVDQLRALGRHQEALEVLIDALADDPENAQAHAALAEVHYDLGDNGEALRHALVALQLDASSYAALRAAALAAAPSRRRDEARAFADRLVSLAPSRSGAHATRAWVYATRQRSKSSDLSTAENSANQAISLDPASPQAWNSAAFVALSQQRRGDARRHLQRALELDPTSEAARHLLSVLEESEGNVSSAMDLVQQLIRERPGDGDTTEHFDALVRSLLGDMLWAAAPISGALCYLGYMLTGGA